MEDLYSSIWLHQEIIDEMRQNLQNTLFELETLKMEAIEKSRTHKEETKQLHKLLKLTQQERDEAKQELSRFLENPNSRSITESNSYSRDESSSPSPSSSELSSFLNIHSQPSMMILEDPTAQNHLDVLVMGRALPETGKFLKAVVEAGPLLQTLLVAGPLPKWVNPPPQTQSQSQTQTQTQTQRFELPPPVSFTSSGLGGSDSLTCSGSVMRFGFGSDSVFDQMMLNRKRQRLD